MANIDIRIVSSILMAEDPDECFRDCLDLGLDKKLLKQPDAKMAFSYMEDFFKREDAWGHVPSVDAMKERFPKLELVPVRDRLVDMINEVRDRDLSDKFSVLLEKYKDLALDKGPKVAVESFVASAAELLERTSFDDDIDFNEVAMDWAIEEQRQFERSPGMMGLPWPWEVLNACTGGIRPGWFGLVFALPKTGKTWFGLYIAMHIWSTGRRVLIYSKEMMSQDTLRRCICILARLDYTKATLGRLTQDEQMRYMNAAEAITTSSNKLIFTTATRADKSPGGPAEIRRKVQKYKPDFVLLDSAYMLELPDTQMNAYDWKYMSLVNRQIKQIAKETKIPIMSILQENERKAIEMKGKSRGTASLAMNGSAIQDCDIAIRLIGDIRRNLLCLHFPATRETIVPPFTINFNVAENFEFSSMESFDFGEADNEEESPRNETGSQVAAVKNASIGRRFSGG